MYEAPHRLVRTLSELLENLGDRRISVCRELTKTHETVFRTTVSEALSYYETEEPRGDCVLVIEGKNRLDIQQEQERSWEAVSIEEHMKRYLDGGTDKKEAMKLVAKDRGMKKRDVYQYLLNAGKEALES